jgi:hypothetical protein
LNAIKKYNQYELVQPGDGADTASVTFYGRRNQEAGTIVYRWAVKGTFSQRVCFKGLDKSVSYIITDADTGARTMITGQQLSKNGFSQLFAADRLSAVLFVEPVKQ